MVTNEFGFVSLSEMKRVMSILRNRTTDDLLLSLNSPLSPEPIRNAIIAILRERGHEIDKS